MFDESLVFRLRVALGGLCLTALGVYGLLTPGLFDEPADNVGRRSRAIGGVVNLAIESVGATGAALGLTTVGIGLVLWAAVTIAHERNAARARPASQHRRV